MRKPGLIWYLLKSLVVLSGQAPAPPRSQTRDTSIVQLLSREAASAIKKLEKAGRWQTQLSRIEEALRVWDRLNTASEGNAVLVTHAAHLAEKIQRTLQEAGLVLATRYQEELDKLNNSALSPKIAASAQRLLAEIEGISHSFPQLLPLKYRFAPALVELQKLGEYANTVKQRYAAAQGLDRKGERRLAIEAYLELLYSIRTDCIDDAEQADLISMIEVRVRALVKKAYVVERKKLRKLVLPLPTEEG